MPPESKTQTGLTGEQATQLISSSITLMKNAQAEFLRNPSSLSLEGFRQAAISAIRSADAISKSTNATDPDIKFDANMLRRDAESKLKLCDIEALALRQQSARTPAFDNQIVRLSAAFLSSSNILPKSDIDRIGDLKYFAEARLRLDNSSMLAAIPVPVGQRFIKSLGAIDAAAERPSLGNKPASARKEPIVPLETAESQARKDKLDAVADQFVDFQTEYLKLRDKIGDNTGTQEQQDKMASLIRGMQSRAEHLARLGAPEKLLKNTSTIVARAEDYLRTRGEVGPAQDKFYAAAEKFNRALHSGKPATEEANAVIAAGEKIKKLPLMDLSVKGDAQKLIDVATKAKQDMAMLAYKKAERDYGPAQNAEKEVDVKKSETLILAAVALINAGVQERECRRALAVANEALERLDESRKLGSFEVGQLHIQLDDARVALERRAASNVAAKKPGQMGPI